MRQCDACQVVDAAAKVKTAVTRTLQNRLLLLIGKRMVPIPTRQQQQLPEASFLLLNEIEVEFHFDSDSDASDALWNLSLHFHNSALHYFWTFCSCLGLLS